MIEGGCLCGRGGGEGFSEAGGRSSPPERVARVCLTGSKMGPEIEVVGPATSPGSQ